MKQIKTKISLINRSLKYKAKKGIPENNISGISYFPSSPVFNLTRRNVKIISQQPELKIIQVDLDKYSPIMFYIDGEMQLVPVKESIIIP